MSLLKKLAGETVIYGLSSIVGRVLNYLLVPLYTNLFLKEEYGIVTQLYASVALLMVLFIYRMDTAFFRFGTKKEGRSTVYTTTFWSVAVAAFSFSLLMIFFASEIAAWYALPIGGEDYIKIFGLVLAYDTLSEIPLAKLRLEGRPIRFALVRLTGIGLNISLNLFFLVLCPWLLEQGYAGDFMRLIYNPFLGIKYIFIVNLISSATVFLLLTPELKGLKLEFDYQQWKKMFRYAAPLVLASLAGIVNEVIDREMLVRFLPFDIDVNRGEQGVYSACYKLAMLMSLFTQAFRYAAEPFFFANAKKKGAMLMYADVTKYFSIIGSVAFLVIIFYLDVFKYFIGEEYWEGLKVVPILLVANLFLGLYYNISIWYKLTDRTNIGGIIAIGGAFITITLNYLLIPKVGYVGSAWATLACYFSMTIACWLWGKKYYPVQYNVGRIGYYIMSALLLFGLSSYLQSTFFFTQQVIYIVNSLLLLLYLFVTLRLEISEFKNHTY